MVGGHANPQDVVEIARKEVEARADELRAGRAALCFSGGKDSVACLLLLKPYLDHVPVLFANPGKHYPETLDIVAQAREWAPLWVEVTTDKDAQCKANGLPSDLVPVDASVPGAAFSGGMVKVQSYLECCWQNISRPLWQRAKVMGITTLIRGQRNEEDRKSLSRTGSEFDGMTLWHPVEKWTKWQVFDFIRGELGRLPAHYHLEHTSLDCWDCTAYTRNAHDRANYTRVHHPELHAEYIEKMVRVYQPMREQMNHYEAILRAGTA